MKLLISAILITLIAAGGLTMFLTGSFKKGPPEDQMLDGIDGTQQTVEAGTDIESEAGDAELPEIVETPEEKTARLLAELMVKLEDSESRLAAAEAKQKEYEARAIAAEAALVAIKTESESFAVKTQRLAKLYGSMKPDSAATILCKLEEDLSLRILKEMNDRASGKLMDAIVTANPDYAAKISELMAGPDTPDS